MANWDEVLTELQGVVAAAADVKSRHFAEAADALLPVIDDLRLHLGLVDIHTEVEPPAAEQPAI